MTTPFENLEADKSPIKTYRKLLWALQQMNDVQLDAVITVEDPGLEECFLAELRIAGENHASLEVFHPLIYVSQLE